MLAVRVGHAALIPKLLEVARANERVQAELALSALAAITGWDARFDAHGAPRPTGDVSADYERECAP